jgi:hypothetical protein
VTVIDVVFPVFVMPPGVDVTVKLFMALPFEAGTLKVTMAVPFLLPCCACTFAGASGTVAGVTDFEGLDGGPVPPALVDEPAAHACPNPPPA